MDKIKNGNKGKGNLIIPNKLLCEYAVRPIGIDTKNPGFHGRFQRVFHRMPIEYLYQHRHKD